jgi:hypothetical protein
MAVVALLVCVGCGAGTSAGIEFGYTTPFLPITITIDNHGDIAVHGSADIVTPVGTFSIDADVTKAMASQSGATLLIIRHRNNGTVVDTVYTVQTQQITVVLNGRVTLTVTNGRVFVDASKGQVLSITIRSTATPSPSAPPVSPGKPYTDPLTSTEHASGWPSGPYYPPPGAADSDRAIFCGFQPDGYHVGPTDNDLDALCLNQDLTFGNGTISVTATLVDDDPAGRAASALTYDDGYGIYIREVNYPPIGFSVIPSGAWCANDMCDGDMHPVNPAIHRGLNVSNTLAIRAEGSKFQFYVNGVNIGNETIDSAPAEGAVGFYVDQYDSAVYRDLVTKP